MRGPFAAGSTSAGQTLLLVDLEVPDLPQGRVTVARVRLESHSTPEERLEQMTEVLGYLEEIDHPLVLTGDFNTTRGEGVPTSLEHKLRQELGEEEFWLDTALDVADGAGFLLDLFESGVDRFRGHTDPTVADLPLLADNPEEELFETIEAFRFADGGRFRDHVTWSGACSCTRPGAGRGEGSSGQPSSIAGASTITVAYTPRGRVVSSAVLFLDSVQ